MTLRQKNVIIFPFYLTAVPIIFLFSLLVSIYQDEIYLEPLQYGFLIIYVITVVYTIFIYGYANFYLFFTLMSAFFVYDAFFFSIFFDYDFLIADFPVRIQFAKETGFLLIILSFIMIYTVHIFYVLFSRKKNDKQIIVLQSNNKYFENIGIFFMLVFLIPVITKLYIQFKFVLDNGYLSVFTGKLDELTYPIWTTGSYIFFSVGYFIFFSSFPKNKQRYILISAIYIVILIFNSLKGQRGYVLYALIAIIIWYSKLYNIKLKTSSLVNIIILFLIFSILIGNIRWIYGNNKNSNNVLFNDVSKRIESFLYGQTITRIVPMLIIEKDLKHHLYPFILSPRVGFLLKTVSSVNGYADEEYEKKLELENNISDILMYNVSKKHWLIGRGYGGSVIAEFYEFGGVFGFIILCIILSLLLSKCDNFFISSKYRFITPLVFLISINFASLPRNRFLGFFRVIETICILSIFVCLIIPLIKYIKTRNIEEKSMIGLKI